MCNLSSKKTVTLAIGLVLVAGLAWVLVAWDNTYANNSVVVVYFGRPSDILAYLHSQWAVLFYGGLRCTLVAISSLILSGVLSVILLTVGLLFEGGVKAIERIAAISQTVPMLVIVTVSLLLENQSFLFLGIAPSTGWYCVLPVTVALIFPPLVNGAGAIDRAPIELKAMLTLWKPSRLPCVRHVYLPLAIPEILTGIRTSATWAVGATLIVEGLLNGVNGDSSTLGHFLMRPFSNVVPGRTPTVIVVATVLGFAVYHLSVVMQKIIENRLHGNTAIAEVAPAPE
jgi:ABC-type nitrate/sulfonate/bicarbonate transport system permease component